MDAYCSPIKDIADKDDRWVAYLSVPKGTAKIELPWLVNNKSHSI